MSSIGFKLVLLGLSLFSYAACGKPAALPHYGTIPLFQFQDETGQSVGVQQLRGKVWVANFIFTSCAGTCPILTQKMRGLDADLPSELPVRFVSFTVDPQTDTLERLSTYRKQQQAVSSRWFFLRSSEPDTRKLLLEGFRVAFDKQEGDDFIHSEKFALVDQDLHVRGYYDADAEGLRELRFAILRLLKNQNE